MNSKTTVTRSADVAVIHERLLAASPARQKFIDIGNGRQAHAIEAGEGKPLLLLHSGGTSALIFLPLLERLSGIRAIAVDRPGLGLSDPIDIGGGRLRQAVIEWLDCVLDGLGLDETALLGNSMGGACALWYALAHPKRVRRLVLMGASPALAGISIPFPLRLMLTPGLGDLMSRLMKPSPQMMVQMWDSFGEKETIQKYPEQIEALVVMARDPLGAKVSQIEHRALATPFGARRPMQVLPDELRQLAMPTLLVWGENDPIGGAAVAQATAQAIPNAQLELLPGGHTPWLGQPERTAELITAFVH